MNYKSNKYLFFFVIIIIISLIISFFTKSNPKLVSSRPLNNSNLTDLRSTITLKFDRKIDLSNFTFEILPSEIMVPIQLTDDSIGISFNKPLLMNSKYLMTIIFEGEMLDEINFTTNTPPDTQYDARFVEEVQQNMDTKYPLIIKTPYNTPSFKVVYSAPLTLEINIKNPNLTSQEVIDEVKAWVTKNGGDVEAHQYTIK